MPRHDIDRRLDELRRENDEILMRMKRREWELYGTPKWQRMLDVLEMHVGGAFSRFWRLLVLRTVYIVNWVLAMAFQLLVIYWLLWLIF